MQSIYGGYLDSVHFLDSLHYVGWLRHYADRLRKLEIAYRSYVVLYQKDWTLQKEIKGVHSKWPLPFKAT